MTTDSSATPWRVLAAGASDPGRVRPNNEDCFLVSVEKNLFVISDGMGGHRAGELVSRLVVEVLPEIIYRRRAALTMPSLAEAEKLLSESIFELNHHLRNEALKNSDLEGAGATAVVVWIRDRLAHMAHVGDSRVYCLREHGLFQLTEDHSVIALLLQEGEITSEEARHHPARGQLSRYIGMELNTYPDVRTEELQVGDRLLLCSDGLHGMISDPQIRKILRANDDPASACTALISATNDAGGNDNVTVVIIACEPN